VIIFSVYINGFNDGQQDYRFYECCRSSNGLYRYRRWRGFSWDAIWDSEVSITDFGWVVEMKIPSRFAILKIRKSNMGIKFHERNKKRCSVHLELC
jgi:hypothetical protein